MLSRPTIAACALLIAACGGEDRPFPGAVSPAPSPAPTTQVGASNAEPTNPQASHVEVSDLRATPTPPGAPNGAVYLTLKNKGAEASVVKVTGEVSTAIELHTHTAGEDGAMTMRKIDAVTLPAGETVRFEPGGNHIMLIGLAAPLQDGASFDLKLHYADESYAELHVPVGDAAVDGSAP